MLVDFIPALVYFIKLCEPLFASFYDNLMANEHVGLMSEQTTYFISCFVCSDM